MWLLFLYFCVYFYLRHLLNDQQILIWGKDGMCCFGVPYTYAVHLESCDILTVCLNWVFFQPVNHASWGFLIIRNQWLSRMFFGYGVVVFERWLNRVLHCLACNKEVWASTQVLTVRTLSKSFMRNCSALLVSVHHTLLFCLTDRSSGNWRDYILVLVCEALCFRHWHNGSY